MAMMIKYKVKEVATDLNVTTKDVITVLKEYCGSDKKAMTALTEDELNVIFDFFTQKFAVADFSAYFAVRDTAIEKQQQEAEQRKAEEKKRREEEKDRLRPESAKQNAAKTAPAQPQPQKKEKTDKTAEVDLKSEIKSKRGTGRIVDTGAAEVNVDRYNQKYDDLALDKVRNENNMSSKKQKINQKSKQRPSASAWIASRRSARPRR